MSNVTYTIVPGDTLTGIAKKLSTPTNKVTVNDLGKSNNRICAGLVTPYPPGIRLLVPGQHITQELSRRKLADTQQCHRQSNVI